MKIMIAGHGNLADGVKSNLSLFVDTKDIVTINAYLDDSDYTEVIREFVNECKADEVRIIFADILGGSVMNKIIEINDKPNIKMIVGFNIALILEIMVSNIKDEEELERVIENARVQMQLIKLDKEIKEVDEDDFLA